MWPPLSCRSGVCYLAILPAEGDREELYGDMSLHYQRGQHLMQLFCAWETHKELKALLSIMHENALPSHMSEIALPAAGCHE